ncbi:MAG: branched-chain amino acid ABC transporter permease [Acidisphaera sp.]|nr:branched-chain amino acid ABC transporter permease [Acidisphaera sp.]MBV9811395.1 branched-chain amino acid ABC transporter permease [Acetobacteraceae bacterium]
MSDAALAGASPAPLRRPRWLRRTLPWVGAACLLAVAPHLLTSGTSLTIMSLMGITVVFSLSYNMLLGQTGLLSFGHAVHYGLGAFFTVHAMNATIAARLPLPLPFMPLVGGAAGLVSGLAFGALSTRRAGTAFAMITLGIGELVASSANVLRSFFGGEEGVTTNRSKLLHVLGWSFGPQLQIYHLIAAWLLVCALLMYGITRTPLGRMCNATRDNPERVQFLGYDPHRVRLMAFALAATFAGIAGGLAAVNFEIANSNMLGAEQSGLVLLATFVGGTRYFAGPIVGAVLVTYLQSMLSDVTELWQLYFGLLFIAVVLFAPGGIAGVIAMHGPALRAGTLPRLAPSYLLALLPALAAFLGAVTLTEMTYHAIQKTADGPLMTLWSLPLDVSRPLPWIAAAALLALGVAGLRLLAPRVAAAFAQATA